MIGGSGEAMSGGVPRNYSPLITYYHTRSLQRPVARMIHRYDDDDSGLDADFPLGDGSADTGAVVVCPYCGETAEIALDPGSGASQSYVEDCPVCCQPWELVVRFLADGSARVQAERADDA